MAWAAGLLFGGLGIAAVGYGATTVGLDGGLSWLGERQAEARTVYDVPYTAAQTWSSTLRMLRVDLGLRVLERDEPTGYILFEYQDHGVVGSGAFELLPTERGVRIACRLAKFPRYHETFLLDRLSRKLREDHGTPVIRPPSPDGGVDESDGGSP